MRGSSVRWSGVEIGFKYNRCETAKPERRVLDMESDVSELERQFQTAMFSIYQRAKFEANYNATIFLNMLSDRGALPTAKYLINADKPSDGYTNLWQRQRLDLTVEAMVIENDKWHPLFQPAELRKAEERLAEYQYQAKK